MHRRMLGFDRGRPGLDGRPFFTGQHVIRPAGEAHDPTECWAVVSRPETRYVSVGDADVAYQVFGSGPIDLVFLSGAANIDLQ